MTGADITGAVAVGGSATAPDEPSHIPEAMAADLVAAWAELSNVHRSKTANAGTFSYSYADLGDLLAVARPVLHKHGLALIQPLSRDGTPAITILTLLVHKSGAVLSWPFQVQATGSPQQVGSAITYGRRYAASSALGMAYEGEDDDGAAATKAAPPPSPARRVRPPASAEEAITRKAMALFAEAGLADRDARLATTSRILDRDVASWTDTDLAERRTVVDVLEAELAMDGGDDAS